MTIGRGDSTSRPGDTPSHSLSSDLTPNPDHAISLGLRDKAPTIANRKTQDQNDDSPTMGRLPRSDVVDAPHSIMERSLLGSLAHPNSRMLLAGLVLWGFCLTSCLGLLPAPGMTGQGHRVADTVRTSEHRPHPGHTSDQAHGAFSAGVKFNAEFLRPLIQHSNLLLPLKFVPPAKKSQLSKNISKSIESFIVTEKGTDSISQTKTPGFSFSRWNNLDFAAYLTLPFSVRSYLKGFKNPHNNLSTMRSFRSENKQKTVGAYSKRSNDIHIEPKSHRSIFKNIYRKNSDIEPKRGFKSWSNTLNHRQFLPIKDKAVVAKSKKKLERELEEEDNLPALIQDTVQKMQNRLDYLSYLAQKTNNNINIGETQSKNSKFQNRLRNDSLKLEATATATFDYLNQTNITTRHTQRHTAIRSGFHQSSRKFDTAKANAAMSNSSQEELDDKSDEVLEDEVMSAVVRAIALGKVPEDVHFWRNVSHFMDSNAYLSRTRRSSYRSRYLRRWRPSTRGSSRNPSRSSSRYMNMMRARFTITYNHVRPCLRRDRYYCMNGGSCVFVVALDIKTCRCPIGYTGVRCEFIDQEYILSLLSNSLVETLADASR